MSDESRELAFMTRLVRAGETADLGAGFQRALEAMEASVPSREAMAAYR